MNLNPFKLPTPAQKAARDLAQAELQLLDAHTMAEHANAMLGYHAKRVARLRALVAAHDKVEGESRVTVVNLPVIDQNDACSNPKAWAKTMNFGGGAA